MGNLIAEKMALIMADVPGIAKNQKNKSQGFMFRGIDDIYATLHPILSNHGVFIQTEIVGQLDSREVTSANGTAGINRVIHYKFKFTAKDGSFVTSEALGEAIDYGDKACNKAASVAQKYSFIQTFCIPTGDEETDAYSHSLVNQSSSVGTGSTSGVRPPSGAPQAPANGAGGQSGARTSRGPTEKQIKRLWGIGDSKGWTSDQMDQLCFVTFGHYQEALTRGEYDKVCDTLLPAGPSQLNIESVNADQGSPIPKELLP